MSRKTSKVLALCVISVCCLQFGAAEKAFPGCGKRLFTVLELDVLFKDEAQGRPACYPLTLMVTPSNGRVYISNNLTKDFAPHVAGAHAASYFMAEAIKRSDHYTPHLDQADLVFVSDYCYWIWWLAWLNFTSLTMKIKPHDRTPGDYLVSAYGKLMETPRWQANKGADFVFFDGHPGFYEGDAKQQIWPMRCGGMQNSVQILAGLPQRRRCPGFLNLKNRYVVAPLMTPLADPNDEHIYTHMLPTFMERAQKEHEKQAARVPLEQRDKLIYFKGRCDPHSRKHAGRRMRNFLARETFKDPSEKLEVACLEDEVPAAELLEITATYRGMRSAVFCLILPGQDQMTSAVAESFLSGCIPIFIGPPWHSVPFAGVIDYKASAIFLDLQNTTAFFEQASPACPGQLFCENSSVHAPSSHLEDCCTECGSYPHKDVMLTSRGRVS